MSANPEPDFVALAERLRASTVRVFDERHGAGSGVIWTSGGLVITNAHVVRGRYPSVVFEDGRRVRARLLERDPEHDLAALGLERSGLRSVVRAEVRDAATLRPGELVVAVGNPFGLEGALSTGVVARRTKRWVIAHVRLAPGNSGGPLADAAGRVVGINSMVANGLALAVPSGAVADFLARVHAPAA
ncbi:MAG TPA: trypsin-like peptidase domain-containing protein [Candidatus Baltobacteraceae bacterium]|nr:trypsin-like peptidase domain-containing protein [Candidatus Baltobacteraceae bacterium]